ncbi:Chromosome (plasmid) partitioning protein ParA [Olavius algarvensis associated proteobacterium Delta 3]|nr:Chromosome (plasmid) partitioning protein ParA [Olavius algarvensis associated proteobacterium Delta 3]
MPYPNKGTMAHVICIVSQKGGTGKTTSSVNIAGALALFEKRTLLIDCDPLGNATTGLGIEKDGLPGTLFHALTGRFTIQDVTLTTQLEFLNIVPARFELLESEQKLMFLPNRNTRLRSVIGAVRSQYDYVIIDSPPSLNFLAISAIASADWLLVPMQCQLFTLEGLGQLLAIAREIKTRHNPDLRIGGILFTMCEKHRNGAAVCTGKVLDNFTDNIFQSTIPWDRRLRESSDYGKPLVLHDITAKGADAYLKLTLELIRFFENRESAIQPPKPEAPPVNSSPKNVSENTGALSA